MVGCGMSATFGQLLLWRWVTGVGSALQMAGAQLFLTDISVSGNRARTLGTNQARRRAHARGFISAVFFRPYAWPGVS